MQNETKLTEMEEEGPDALEMAAQEDEKGEKEKGEEVNSLLYLIHIFPFNN